MTYIPTYEDTYEHDVEERIYIARIFRDNIREGVKKKTIESVSMIIPDRGGGGSAGGDHTLLGFFFNAPNLVGWLY